VKGKKKKVRFSLASSAVTGLAGVAVAGRGVQELLVSGSSAAGSGDQAGALSAQGAEMQALDQGSRAAAESSSSILGPELLIFAGAGLITVSAGTLVFGLVLDRLATDSKAT
jgi:hypothetical protein